MYGLTVEEASGPPIEVWPDNWESVMFFANDACMQWRMGPSGPFALDYGVVTQLLALRKLPESVFDDVQVMEAEALQEIKRQQNKGKS